MKRVNLYGDEWDETRDLARWRIKEAFVGHRIAFPRGKEGAHQIMNRTDSPIRVLMLSSMVAPDIVVYIDSGKVYGTDLAGEPIMFSRPGPTVDYWEGEE